MLLGSIYESVFWTLLYVGSCLWLISWWLGRIGGGTDKDGKIKSAVQGGIIRLIQRWLK